MLETITLHDKTLQNLAAITFIIGIIALVAISTQIPAPVPPALLTEGSATALEGTITRTIDYPDKQIAYLRYEGTLPILLDTTALQSGDKVVVEGKISTYKGAAQLEAKRITFKK